MPETANSTDTAQSSNELPSTNLKALSERERDRLRLLARRYRVRADTTLRPVADVMYDLRSLHGVKLSMTQVFELLTRQAE
jgi:hypothetical protein